MNHYFQNWRTTSMGLTVIFTAVVPLVAAVATHTSTQAIWFAAIPTILTGIGLIFSQDSTASAARIEKVKQDVADAINTGDTGTLTKK